MAERLAVDGGVPVRSAPFPRWPQWDDEERTALHQVLDSGEWWSMAGGQVTAFVHEFAEAHQASHGVGCTNGSAALEICLRAMDIEWGEEVITSSYSFIATANAALLVGAVPRFADVLPGTWNLDPSHVEQLITPRTRAIIAVHIGGEPADMDALRRIAGQHGIVLIEDAAQAHGAAWRGQRVGAIGDMGTFSFQSSKNVTAGEGGMVLTNSEDWYERCWSVVNVGRKPGGAFYDHVGLASNYRLTEWQAAVLRVQLTRLFDLNRRRQHSAAYLRTGMAEIEGLDMIPGDPRVTDDACHLLRLHYEPRAFGERTTADFVRAMRAEGVPIGRGYIEPFGSQAMILRETAKICGRLGLAVPEDGPWPVCADICENGLWLHHAMLLGDEADLDDILRAAAKVKAAWAG